VSRPIATDPLVCNGSALRKASRRVSQLYDNVLAPCGLSGAQRSILIHIERSDGPPTMTQLANALVLDRTALARNLKPLERDGFVRVVEDERDGRTRHIALTAQGKRKLDEANRLWRNAQSRFEAAYGEKQAKELRHALAVLFSDEFEEAFTAQR